MNSGEDKGDTYLDFYRKRKHWKLAEHKKLKIECDDVSATTGFSGGQGCPPEKPVA